MEIIAPCILTLGLDGGEQSASHPRWFTLGKRAPRAHLIGGWLMSLNKNNLPPAKF